MCVYRVSHYYDIHACVPNSGEACFLTNKSGAIPGDEGWEWKPSPGAHLLGKRWLLCCGHLTSRCWCWVSWCQGTAPRISLASLYLYMPVSCVGLPMVLCFSLLMGFLLYGSQSLWRDAADTVITSPVVGVGTRRSHGCCGLEVHSLRCGFILPGLHLNGALQPRWLW